MTIYVVLIAASYLAGSLPFGLILTKMAGLGDIRQIGSGNVGATNVLRTGRKGIAATTLILDAAKGALPVLAVIYWPGGLGHPDLALLAGLAAVLGHNFPIWLKFRGGKGVATTFGVLLAAAWPVGLAGFVVWLIAAALFRYSSLAAIIALALTPFAAWWLTSPRLAALAALLGV
ncbi:MAG: glycerol-3-phosphate 1-O-acyltransferase PlsY, partial [Rhodospirillales bacterium]|nr:glycerol-3-phosphate 1-O-acyltransferase PlsY [Rhodospirillales bacterium]